MGRTRGGLQYGPARKASEFEAAAPRELMDPMPYPSEATVSTAAVVAMTLDMINIRRRLWLHEYSTVQFKVMMCLDNEEERRERVGPGSG